MNQGLPITLNNSKSDSFGPKISPNIWLESAWKTEQNELIKNSHFASIYRIWFIVSYKNGQKIYENLHGMSTEPIFFSFS